MSKYLVKILSLCAIVVLFCVSIVGAAICGTEAVVCTFSLAEAGIKGQYAPDSKIEVLVDGKAVTTNEPIKVAKYTEIKVVWDGEGYEFKGWQKGNYDANKKYVNTDKAYTFEIKGNTKLFAVENVLKYNVQYAGLMDDDQPIQKEAMEYEFDQALDPIIPETEDGKYLGWLLSDEEGNPIEANIYTQANFDSKYANNADETNKVYLTPAWDNLMRVTLKDTKGNIIKTERLKKESVAGYTLPTLESEEVSKHLEAGYVFNGWKNADNNEKVETIGEFDPNGIVLIMDTTQIDYTVKVKFNEVSETTKDVKYTVTDGDDLAYAADTREGYTLKEATYNGHTYPYADGKFTGLGKAIIEKEKDNKTAQVTVENVVLVWECKYGESSFKFKFEGLTTDRRAVYKEANKQDKTDPVEVDEVEVIFQDKANSDNDPTYAALEDDVFEKFMKQFTEVYAQNSSDKLTFKGRVIISVNPGGPENELIKSLDNTKLTFAQIFSIIEKEIHANATNGEITVSFIYE